jgi:hypothetical protein
MYVTQLRIFCRGVGYTAELQPNRGRDGTESDEGLSARGHTRMRGPRAMTDGVKGHQSTGGPCLWHHSAVDTRHVPIGEAQKYL